MNRKNLLTFLCVILFLSFGATNVSSEEQQIIQPELSNTTIQLVDPDTKDVVKTIIPQELQLVLDFKSFKDDVTAIVSNLANGTFGKSGYNKRLILDRYDPTTDEIIKGRPKITLIEDELVEKILESSFTGGKIEIPLKYTESGYNEEEVSSLNEVVLASYTTYFNQNRIGRSKNIELSAVSINNLIVGSGDIFSFNDTVGPRDVTAGYQEAPEFVQGKIVIGIGGGICQTSTTLFNAVDRLGVEVLERHHHSRDVGYIPKGRDATVSFGGLDFRFQNTTGIPFMIKTYYGYGAITVQIKTSKENEYMLKNLENY